MKIRHYLLTAFAVLALAGCDKPAETETPSTATQTADVPAEDVIKTEIPADIKAEAEKEVTAENAEEVAAQLEKEIDAELK